MESTEGLSRTGQIIDLRSQLQEAIDRATAAEAAKNSFLSNMSHELRTPLHGILSFARLGKEKSETMTADKALKFFSQIEESGERLLELVNGLLDLAKLESGRMAFHFERTSVNGIFDAVIQELAEYAAAKQVEVRYTEREAIPAVVDVKRFTQVVHQMVHNAITYTTADSVVEISLLLLGDCLRASVSDQGPGIPEGELESIFEAFVQSSRTETKAGGTGLGLAICGQIVESHQGQLWAENRADIGARFILEMPNNLAVTPTSDQSPK